MVISMLKIRRPLGRLIFNMGIAIPGKTLFLIETAPWIRELLFCYVDDAGTFVKATHKLKSTEASRVMHSVNIFFDIGLGKVEQRVELPVRCDTI